MQYNKFTWVVVSMLAVALLFNHVINRIPIGVSKVLPIDTFPKKIGNWVGGNDIPSDNDVRRMLPKAHICERVYHKGDSAVSLLLLTSPVPSEFHDPMVCMPAQGWVTKSRTTRKINGHSATIMKSETKNKVITMIYWYDGYMESVKPHGIFMRTMYKIRNLVLNREEGISLFVRIIYEEGNDSGNIDDFLNGIRYPLDEMVKSRA